MPKVKQESPIARWTAVWWADEEEDIDEMLERIPILKDFLMDECKHWVFQIERGEESGRLHFQIRISLKNRTRLGPLVKAAKKLNDIKPVDFRPESTAGEKMSKFYHIKSRTRVWGPYSDKDDPPHIPSDWNSVPDMPWHQEVLDMMNSCNRRELVLVVDPNGGTGKTALTRKLVMAGGKEVPSFLGGAKDMMRAAHAMVDGGNPDKVYKMIFDIPRSQTRCQKDFWWHAATALEKLKDGVVIEDRYVFQMTYINPPQIIVFTNEAPPDGCLSAGRWKVYSME